MSEELIKKDLVSPELTEKEFALKLEQIELQREIVALKKEQLTNANTSGKARISLSPLATTVLAGVVGLIGTGVGALAQGWFNRQLERDKFEFNKQIERQKNEANLVLKVVETGNLEEAQRNLLFLVKAGFIEDPNGRIAALAKDPNTAPVLPKSSSDTAPTETRGTFDYKVGDEDVYLEVIVGYAHYAKFTVTLFDDAGKNPEKIGDGTTTGNTPGKFKIGSGPRLVGKTVVIQTVVADPSGGETVPVNVQYKLTGGPTERVFTVRGQTTGSVAIYSHSIKVGS